MTWCIAVRFALLPLALASAALPTNFDVRKQWPGCSSEILNQGGCGSCWAFGSAEAISDRFCIKGVKVQLSPQSLVSCSACKGSCKGGAPSNALKYMASQGLQSCTNSCTSGCEPYGSGKKPPGCTDPITRCHGCDKQCHDGTAAKFYKVDAGSIVHGKLDSDEDKIMTEIQTHGSVTGTLGVYSNWHSWVKKHGPDSVYDTHENATHVGGHAIKIIGFGISQGKKYWLIQNSWGPNFGDHGTIKMLRGGGAAKGIIGDNSYYATPVLKEVELDNNMTHEVRQTENMMTGEWTEGDGSHPFWRGLAGDALAGSNVAGDLVNIEKVESQVIAGINARFTITTSAGVRAVIKTSLGADGELLEAPAVEASAPMELTVV